MRSLFSPSYPLSRRARLGVLLTLRGGDSHE
jgi:hypothetical protein